MLRPISSFPETTNFLKHRNHTGIVFDEHEDISGIITLEDLLETILGKEIVD